VPCADSRDLAMTPPRSATPDPWHLIFDGQCAFCQRCVALLRRWDRGGRLRCVPLQDKAALAALPPIPGAALEQAMHLVTADGAVYAGAEAVPPLLRVLPGGPPLALLFGIPGVPGLANRIYRWVARNRHQLGCGSAVCHRHDG